MGFQQTERKATEKLAGSPPRVQSTARPLPQNVICYEFDETNAKLIVYLSCPYEVTFKDSSIIKYATRAKAILLRGKLTCIEGMKTKVLVWVKVTNVLVEGNKSDKVSFTAGVKKSRPQDAYETPRDAVRVEEF